MLDHERTEVNIARAREHFANFEAVIKDCGDLTVIDWRDRDGSGNWAVRYILDGCRLVVTGDIGNAIFRRAEPYTLEYCGKMIIDPGYSARKCVAKERDTSLYNWDRASVKRDLDEYFQYVTEDEGYSAEEVEDIEDIKADLLENCGFNGVYIDAYMYERLPDWVDDISTLQECGMQYSLHFIAWLVGLQMIAEQQVNNVLYGPKLELEVTNGKKLVAEINPDLSYKELFVYLEDGQGRSVQDIAVIGEKYSYDETDSDSQNIIPHPGKYVARVYGDANDECYTDCFEIGEYVPEEGWCF